MLFRNSLKDVLILFPAVVISLLLHELSHGWAAYLLGDTTAKEAGRLSLNPLKHLDPMGTLMMLVAGIGWARPVPIDPGQFHMKNRRLGFAITAAAGPLCNFVLAFLTVFIYGLLLIWRRGQLSDTAAQALTTFAMLNIGLGAFNLIPVPPLDGSRLLLPVLPKKAAAFLLRYERYFGMVFFLLVATGIVSKPLTAVRTAIGRTIIRWALSLAAGLGGIG